MSKKPTIRKYCRSTASRRKVITIDSDLMLSEMFERFMLYKETEGLTQVTINDYYLHYKYLLDYLEEDISADQLSTELFRAYIGYMLHDKELSPMTTNVRIRTIRAFLRYCYSEEWISEPIHERFKPVKTKEDTLESFTLKK